MKLLVCGSRTIDDLPFVIETIDTCPWDPDVLVHGGADGVDASVEAGETYGMYGDEFETEVHPIPDWVWDHLGRQSGPIRNAYMVDQADAVLAIWDGESSGTKDTITKAERAGLPLQVVTVMVDEDGRVVETLNVRESDTEQMRFGDFEG